MFFFSFKSWIIQDRSDVVAQFHVRADLILQCPCIPLITTTNVCPPPSAASLQPAQQYSTKVKSFISVKVMYNFVFLRSRSSWIPGRLFVFPQGLNLKLWCSKDIFNALLGSALTYLYHRESYFSFFSFQRLCTAGWLCKQTVKLQTRVKGRCAIAVFSSLSQLKDRCFATYVWACWWIVKNVFLKALFSRLRAVSHVPHLMCFNRMLTFQWNCMSTVKYANWKSGSVSVKSW